jgi:hypothetical protein
MPSAFQLHDLLFDAAPTRDDGIAADKRLAAEVTRGPLRPPPDEPSNFEASAEAAFRERQFSRPCKRCSGTGARDIGRRRLASYERRIARAAGETERENIRVKLTRESHCLHCEGSGVHDIPDRANGMQRTLCEDCMGVGTRPGLDGTRHRCRRCKGVGHVCYGKAAWWVTTRCHRCKGRGSESDGLTCGLCLGDGCVVPLTVLPKGSSRHGFGPDVGAAPADPRTAAGKVLDPATERDTAILGAFERLTESSPNAARHLALYRGPIGNRWGHGHPYGRAFVLWPETAAGRQIAARAPDELQREHGASPLTLLAVIRDAEDRARVPRMDLRALFTRADREARLLVEAARSALAGEARS